MTHRRREVSLQAIQGGQRSRGVIPRRSLAYRQDAFLELPGRVLLQS
jgi:hypothetical protein